MFLDLSAGTELFHTIFYITFHNEPTQWQTNQQLD